MPKNKNVYISIFNRETPDELETRLNTFLYDNPNDEYLNCHYAVGYGSGFKGYSAMLITGRRNVNNPGDETDDISPVDSGEPVTDKNNLLTK